MATPPEWGIVSVAEPTNFAPASPATQVEQLAVDASGGDFALSFANLEGSTGPLPYDTTPKEIEEAIHKIFLFAEHGAEVRVSGGPGGERPYVLTFAGAATDTDIETEFGALEVNGNDLTGAGHSATLSIQAAGREAPELVTTATNVGDATAKGTVTIHDDLPAGLRALSVSSGTQQTPEASECSPSPVPTCTWSGAEFANGATRTMTVAVEVPVSGLPSSVTNQATVTGAGAPPASTTTPIAISSAQAGFGPAPGSVMAASSTLQAGAHPDFTTAFTLETKAPGVPIKNPHEVRFDLPPGLVGNTVGIPQCTMAQVVGEVSEPELCPQDTQVGVAKVILKGFEEFQVPVYNIAPAPGEPAAFAYEVGYGTPVRLDTHVLSNGDYGVQVSASDITETQAVLANWVTIWGIPADHNGTQAYRYEEGQARVTRVPLLTNPEQCTEAPVTTMETDAWQERSVFKDESAAMPRFTGCDLLPFVASFSMLPDTLEAGAPSGYQFELNVPQVNDPNNLAKPDVRNVTLTLPMGTVVSPPAAWGLQACTDAQFGLHSGVPGECPRESQVGTAQIKTPALLETLRGDVYLAEPPCDPCTPEDAADGRMVRLFVQIVGEGESGIVVKLEGHAQINQQTGQITTTFEDNPPLPFSEFRLTLGGGPRAVLANPRVCGPTGSTLDVAPWSTPFTADTTEFSNFEINQDCIAPQFNPSFVAGTTNIQAGEYSTFTLSFGRGDADEFLNGFQMQMPEGLLGSLAHVPLCKEPQASEGTCGGESEIGHVQVLTGAGADPFLVTGGHVYLTEGYKGAPFGLAVVVPAKAGPYTLSGTTGKGTVVVRAAINIDPTTTALTITADPLPTALDGIPLQLRAVNVTIDRPDFTFNPTSCNKMAITGTLTSKESAGVSLDSPFQVTNCAGLGFHPTFKVSTSGHTSRLDGADLDAKLIYPLGPKLANVAKVKVELPKQLPSRLATLQKACPQAIFRSNPGACPAPSIVGIARASTPVLPVELVGPVYFVSNGGEAFPNLIMVLQGYGVRFDLVGDTYISKAGITSSTFQNVPDVPISSFEIYLPEGPYSALTALGNLCKSRLTMPTSFVGQNGAELHQQTSIAVTNCPKATKKGKARKAARSARARRRHARASRRARRTSYAHRHRAKRGTANRRSK
ncbi:MAG TPA: hypothetical protein VNV42_09180 [Solirubrobacteraceae bacterium]|nr:hypothetical protein [Solirubrobacteraceae bacterium]